MHLSKPLLALAALFGGINPCSSLFFMVDEATNDLWTISTGSGAATRPMDLGVDVNEVAGLAYDPSNDLLYLATVPADTGIPALFEIDYKLKEVTQLMTLPAEIAGLTWDTSTDSLVGIASELDANFANSKTTLYDIDVDLKTLDARDVIYAGENPFLQSFVTGSLNGAAYNPDDGALYATLASLEGNDGVRLYKIIQNGDGTHTAEIVATMGDESQAQASQRWGLGFEADATGKSILYGVSGDDNSLYKIDITDGSIDFVGELGVNVGPGIGAAGGIPTLDRNDAAGGGDPHFHTFYGDYYAYHGICDLVMVDSAKFGDGLGINVHIRTEERENYSSISNAAVKIGDDVFEVDNDGKHYLNGESGVEFPLKLAGKYTVHKKEGVESNTFTPDVSHGFAPEELVESALYVVKIDDDEHIEIQLWKDYLWVNVRGGYGNFRDTRGLMGSYGSDRKVARNGVTILNDTNEFAEEWQVLDSEPMLFQKVRAPQHPAKCLPPPPAALERRRLGEEQNAKKVCSKVSGPQREFCEYDVMVTGDSGIAKVYERMEEMRKEGWAM